MKWSKLREFFLETFVQKDGKSLKRKTTAKQLEKALGKLHHVTTIWSPGRPPLYSLWCVFFTADFMVIQTRGASRRVLRPNPEQELCLGKHAQKALRVWFERLNDTVPPTRLMLRCNHKPHSTLLSILRVPCKDKGAWLFLSTPEIMAEYREAHLKVSDDGVTKSYETVWLELLLEALLTLDIHTGLQVIYVRTNIWKLAAILEKQLYVKDHAASEVSSAIHEQLWHLAKKANTPRVPTTTLELRCALLPPPYQ